jgi:mannose-6-phosphate isomerase-like protein (cupin superfamily)
MPPPVVNLTRAFERIDKSWTPMLAAELNGQHVRLAKLTGAFVWHSHEHEDELFLVVRGSLRIEFRDGLAELSEGDMIVVPRGVEHRPVADGEAHVLLFEPASTVNTGDGPASERTVRTINRIALDQ